MEKLACITDISTANTFNFASDAFAARARLLPTTFTNSTALVISNTFCTRECVGTGNLLGGTTIAFQFVFA